MPRPWSILLYKGMSNCIPILKRRHQDQSIDIHLEYLHFRCLAVGQSLFREMDRTSPDCVLSDDTQVPSEPLKKTEETTMDRKNLLEQMTAVNRLTFNNAFDAMALFQDKSGKLTKAILDQTDWLPCKSRVAAEVWAEVLKTGRLNWKKQIDDSFKQFEKFFPSNADHNASNS